MELEAGTVGVAGGLGMLPTARAWAQAGQQAARTQPQARGLRAGSRRRGRRKRSRDVRVPGKWAGGAGAKRLLIGARASFTQHNGSRAPGRRAHLGTPHRQLATTQRSRLYSGGTSPRLYTWGAPGGAVGAAESRLQPEEGARGKNLLLDEIKANTGPSALPPPPRPSRACRPPGLHGNSFSRLLGRPFAVTRRKSFLSSGRWETKDVGNWRKGPTWQPPDSCPLPPPYTPQGLGCWCGPGYWGHSIHSQG
ncbi:uncharacterized protein [Alexandromys fortis]|uniref:uncharacterized protein n=1 Tax=Alexandromys fortis TaxID=100897 RepID=UPI0021529F26|nr:uncharacterized protein LOC126503498 [Microtus fortis]